MTAIDTKRVIEERTYDATPEKLWRAWTTGEGLCGWFLDELRGNVEAGQRIEWVWTEFCSAQALHVEEIVPNSRLVLRPLAEGWPDGFIEITIEPAAEGTSKLRLVQSGFRPDADWDEEYEGVRSGWHMALSLLGEYLAGRVGRTRSVALAERKVSFEYDSLAPYYREPGHLSMWLTRSGKIGDEGTEVSLELVDGSTLTGSVLSRTATEVALSWREIDGTLELKAYGLPDSRAVALLASSWSLSEDAMKSQASLLEVALGRLVRILQP